MNLLVMATPTQSRPLFITIIALIFSAHALIVPFLFLFYSISSGDTTINRSGMPVRVGDHRLQILAVLLLWEVLAISIAFGYWKGKQWSRHIIPTIHVVGLVSLVNDRRPEVLFILLYVALIFWYFYGKANVKKYFGVR